MSLVDSGCGVVAIQQPWSVDCKETIRVEHGKSMVNGGQAIDLQAFATVVLDTPSESEEFAAFRYGFKLPAMTMTLNDGTELTTSEVVYPGGGGYRTVLAKSDFNNGICLSNLPEYFPTVSLASLKADSVGLLASAPGADVCVKPTISTTIPLDKGTQLQFVLEAQLFSKDNAIPGTDEAIEAAQEALDLTGPLSFELDMGALLVKSLGVQRRLAAGGYISDDGRFKLGTEVGQGATPPTPAAPTPTTSTNFDGTSSGMVGSDGRGSMAFVLVPCVVALLGIFF